MGAREETLVLIRDGLSPAEIARRRAVTIQTILGYLNEMVGRGKIKRSEILFSIPSETRATIVEALQQGSSHNPRAVVQRLSRRGVTVEEGDVVTVMQYGDARYARGDMYEYICDIEITLHEMVRHTLEGKFGKEEKGWWRQGIPEIIRKKCATRREEDALPCDSPFEYTDLIELSDIITKKGNWELFQGRLHRNYAGNGKELKRHLHRLNGIRNAVMHPVKERNWSEDDLQFVKDVRRRLLGDDLTQQPPAADAQGRTPDAGRCLVEKTD